MTNNQQGGKPIHGNSAINLDDDAVLLGVEQAAQQRYAGVQKTPEQLQQEWEASRADQAVRDAKWLKQRQHRLWRRTIFGALAGACIVAFAGGLHVLVIIPAALICGAVSWQLSARNCAIPLCMLFFCVALTIIEGYALAFGFIQLQVAVFTWILQSCLAVIAGAMIGWMADGANDFDAQ